MSNLKKLYTAARVEAWQGRSDKGKPERYHQIVQCKHPEMVPAGLPARGILGFCCDEGVRRNQGRIGARLGPDACRSSLSNLVTDRHNQPFYDLGDVHCQDGGLEDAQDCLAEVVQAAHANGVNPVVVGGGHETSYGHFRGLQKAFQGKRIGIVNFDAHFDLRPSLPNGKGSSGTPFRQIAELCESEDQCFDYTVVGLQRASNSSSLFEEAQLLGVHYELAENMHSQGIAKAEKLITESSERNEILYVSFCLDVMVEGLAPGVSAPQAFGLQLSQVVPLLHLLTRCQKQVVFALVELCPAHDRGGQTARLAANLVHLMLGA